MRKVKILSDTASDIPMGLETEHDIMLLPLSIIIGEKSYAERFEITLEEFYERFELEPKTPTTSQVTPNLFEDAYRELYSQDYTDVITVSLSSTGSNTHSSALLARRNVYAENPEMESKMKIHIIDSKTYSIGYGHAVVESAKMLKEGKSVEEIIAYLEDWFSHLEIFLIPYNLKYAKKSGRINAAAAFMGELIGLKPLIIMADGTTKVLDKVRGDKNVIPRIADIVCERIEKGSPYCIIRAVTDDPPAQLSEVLTKRLGYGPAYVNKVGSAVLVNCGPDIIAIAIRADKANIESLL